MLSFQLQRVYNFAQFVSFLIHTTILRELSENWPVTYPMTGRERRRRKRHGDEQTIVFSWKVSQSAGVEFINLNERQSQNHCRFMRQKHQRSGTYLQERGPT